MVIGTTNSTDDLSPPAKTLRMTPGAIGVDSDKADAVNGAVVVVSGKPADPMPKMSLQERMLALQENFKQDSSMRGAEVIRRQREEEMNVVRNRWKNGLPSDGSSKQQTADDNVV